MTRIAGKITRLDYVCSACHKGIITFLIDFFQEKVRVQGSDVIYLSMRKVGQVPAWSIKMDKELEKVLGEHAAYYKKGLICESQGYGIGAFSYFRRITEEIIDSLLNEIEGLLQGEDKEKYKIALQEVKKTRVAQEKINLVKDLLPSSLRPGDVNPLGVLHSALSEGLHAKTDEDCLEYAEAVREALAFLVNRLTKTQEENKIFTESMEKLLREKRKK
jgi:hypothetical protein